LPRAGLGYSGARATLAQVFGVLFEVTHLLGQAGPRRGRDHAEAFDNHAGSCQLALELVFNAMVRQLVVIPADQDETRQVAAMGLQEEGFENRYPEAKQPLWHGLGDRWWREM
jgi:hypothetical protein